MHVVVMGVAGCGKSSVGAALAERLGVAFRDADDFHSPESRAKMAAGTALTDEDRWPWLARLHSELSLHLGCVLGCSALRRSYRDALGLPAFFLHLALPPDQAAARLRGRSGHFFPPALLASQVETLEELGNDESGAVVDATADLPAVLESCLRSLPPSLLTHLELAG